MLLLPDLSAIISRRFIILNSPLTELLAPLSGPSGWVNCRADKYFSSPVQVKSVSHDLEQLNRLLHMVKSLVRNPYLYLGSYVRSLVSSVMYCILEPLAASINPLNDHWTLRDYAALLLSHIFR